MPDLGWVEFVTATPALRVTARMGRTPPNVESGYGGWEIVKRPHQQSLTRWTGRDPYRLVIPIMMDEWKSKGSVEDDCSRLERMALPIADHKEPPIVNVNGAVPHADLLWVIENIEWGDLIRTTGGRRARQEATVRLLRYVSEDRMEQQSAREKAKVTAANKAGATKPKATSKNAPTKTTSKLYIVKSGDTLSKIAAKELGDYRKWRAIATLNKLRDPNKISVGQKLRLP